MTFHQVMTHYRLGLTMKTPDRRDVKLMDVHDFQDATMTITVKDISTGLSETLSAWDLSTEWAGAWKAPADMTREDEPLLAIVADSDFLARACQ